MTSLRPNLQRGLSVVEALTVVAVVGVAAGAAAPGFQAAAALRHLEGAAAQLETELHYARAEAILRHQGVRLSFSSPAGGSCYVIHTGAANACTCDTGGGARCVGNAQALRSVLYDAGAPVNFRSNSRSFVFDPEQGTVTPTATIALHNRRGQGVNLVVNIMGRVRSCTPTPPLAGLRAC